jgi:hypothetical protein
VQTQILAQYPSASLRVYAVWVPLPLIISRDTWDATNMPDARVVHFWDGEQIISQWFAKEVDGDQGVSWDMYYLYGPDAVWKTVPAPLVDSGGTIYRERHQLEAQITALLNK